MVMFLQLKGDAEQKYTMKLSSIATRCQAAHELRQIVSRCYLQYAAQGRQRAGTEGQDP